MGRSFLVCEIVCLLSLDSFGIRSLCIRRFGNTLFRVAPSIVLSFRLALTQFWQFLSYLKGENMHRSCLQRKDKKPLNTWTKGMDDIPHPSINKSYWSALWREQYFITNHHRCHMMPHIPRTCPAESIKDKYKNRLAVLFCARIFNYFYYRPRLLNAKILLFSLLRLRHPGTDPALSEASALKRWVR